MQDFLDDLEQRLAQAAAQNAPASKPARSPRNFRRRRPAFLGGLTAALAAGVAAFTMTGTSLAELPILKTETRNATEVRASAPQAAKAGVDFTKAHPFGTPGGPGYVLLNKETDAICLVVPDPDAPGDYGGSCAPSLSTVEREGLIAFLARPGIGGREPSMLSIFVLPEDAENVVVESGGRRSTPEIEAGVAVIDLPSAGTLRWSVDGRPGTRALPEPFRASRAQISCPDGSTATVDLPPRSANPSPRPISPELRREACGR